MIGDGFMNKSAIKFLGNGLVLIEGEDRLVITNWEQKYLSSIENMLSKHYVFLNFFSYSKIEFNVNNVKPDITIRANEIFMELINSSHMLDTIIINSDIDICIPAISISQPERITTLDIQKINPCTLNDVSSIFRSVKNISIYNGIDIDYKHILNSYPDLVSCEIRGVGRSDDVARFVIDNFSELQELYIQIDDIDILDSLGKLSKLKSLTIDSFNLETIPACLYELPSLERLDIRRTQIPMNTFDLFKLVQSEFPNIQDVIFPIALI